MDGGHRVWNAGYHDQPVEAGEGPEGDCGGEVSKAERLSEVPSVQGERRICRTYQPSGETEPPHHSGDHQRQSDWFFQYSPYVYYNEHCIVFNANHTPMKIERATFGKLLDFVTAVPALFCRLQRRSADCRRLDLKPRSFPGRSL